MPPPDCSPGFDLGETTAVETLKKPKNQKLACFFFHHVCLMKQNTKSCRINTLCFLFLKMYIDVVDDAIVTCSI